MKLISLNLWGGIVGQPLFDWLQKKSIDTDIFCFQEVFDAPNPPAKTGKKHEHYQLKSQLEKLLPDFTLVFREHVYNFDMSGNVDFTLKYGLAIAIKNTKLDNILDEGDTMIFGSKRMGFTMDRPTDRNLQYLRLKINDKILNILNYHGIWIKDAGKLDNEFRLQQSSKIIKFVQELDGETILVGDFNLEPKTKSIQMLEDIGLEDLIKSNNITSTRSHFYENIKEIKVGDQIIKNDGSKFADYALISSGVKANNFEVPAVEISDHLPSILDFDLK